MAVVTLGALAVNRLAVAPVVQTSVNRLAVAPPPTKDDLLGPGNTVPLPASSPVTTTTAKLSTSLVSAPLPKAGEGMFDWGPGGPPSGPSAPSPSPGGAAVGGGFDLEHASFDGGGAPSPSGGGGFAPRPSPSGGGGFFAPVASGESSKLPWIVGGVAAVGLVVGAVLLLRR